MIDAVEVVFIILPGPVLEEKRKPTTSVVSSCHMVLLLKSSPAQSDGHFFALCSTDSSVQVSPWVSVHLLEETLCLG